MAKVAKVLTGKGIDAIQVIDQPIPEPGPGEALIRLRAATLNYRDLLIATGRMPGLAKEPDVIPLSCGAGEVLAVGDSVSRVKPGDRVTPIFTQSWVNGSHSPAADLLGGPVDGVARQYAVLPAEGLCHSPDELSDFEVATLPCAALTSWSALTQYRPLQPCEWLLTHGTGGVSIAALQFAKAMGARVAITSSSSAKLARARWLGADLTVNYRTTPDWAAAIRKELGGNSIAHIIDTVGESQFQDNLTLVMGDGQISAVGVLGSSNFSRGDAAGPATVFPTLGRGRDHHEAMIAFIVEHGIRPVVDVVYDLDRLRDSYHHLESGSFFGKVGVNLI